MRRVLLVGLVLLLGRLLVGRLTLSVGLLLLLDVFGELLEETLQRFIVVGFLVR